MGKGESEQGARERQSSGQGTRGGTPQVDAGAEVIITQPPLLWDSFEKWFAAVTRCASQRFSPLPREVRTVGIARRVARCFPL